MSNPYGPEYDLVTWIAHQLSSGEAEADPYSYAMTVIRVILEWALDDGISGAIGEGAEIDLLEELARLITRRDPLFGINPRPA